MDDLLRITEIFYSLQGEAATVGRPSVFIRLTGCPLRCTYCDTAYAFHGGKKVSLKNILSEISKHPARYVTVTGGEPLAQPNCLPLLKQLCDAGYQVSLETAGAFDISAIDPRVSIVMDVKTPESNEHSRNMLSNLKLIKPIDQIKFVICSRNDFDWANEFVKSHRLPVEQVLYSPSHGEVKEKQLAEWILESDIPVRFQFQLHKLLWGDKPGV